RAAGGDGRAATLAATRRAHGVGADVAVGMYLARSRDLVIALLAILKAGGAYLPLDPAYPWERLAFMVQDSRAPVIVTRSGMTRRLAGLPVTLGELDAQAMAAAAPPGRRGRGSPHHPAYVIYTSGSTRNPNGVRIPHRDD